MSGTWAESLEEDLSWRETELASLKRLAITSSANNVAYRAVLRGSWAMLYAHFEGFTYFCWELLFDEIQKTGILTKELNEKFKIISAERECKNLRANLDSKSILEFFNSSYPACQESPATFHENDRLKADSNLWPNVFVRESERIGLDCSEIDAQRTRIMALVKRRNDIAHGKRMIISSVVEFSRYEDAALSVMHDLAVQVVDILDLQLYRESVVSL